jgi:hypothetical protein
VQQEILERLFGDRGNAPSVGDVRSTFFSSNFTLSSAVPEKLPSLIVPSKFLPLKCATLSWVSP